MRAAALTTAVATAVLAGWTGVGFAVALPTGRSAASHAEARTAHAGRCSTRTGAGVFAPPAVRFPRNAAGFRLFPAAGSGAAPGVVAAALDSVGAADARFGLAGGETGDDPGPSPRLAAHPFAGFGHSLVTDTVSVVGAPLRWDRSEWLTALAGIAGVAALTAVDENIAHSVQAHRNATSDKVAHYVEPFGADRAFETIGAFYIAGLVFHDDRAKDVAADSVISSIIAGGLISPVIKKVVGRSRPSQTGGEEDVVHSFGSGVSFPSGHTTEAFAVASVIATHYSSEWVKFASYGLATMVGLARIDHNAHFASDVLGGALLGTVVGRAVVHLDDARRMQASGHEVAVSPLVTARGAGIDVQLRF